MKKKFQTERPSLNNMFLSCDQTEPCHATRCRPLIMAIAAAYLKLAPTAIGLFEGQVVQSSGSNFAEITADRQYQAGRQVR